MKQTILSCFEEAPLPANFRTTGFQAFPLARPGKNRAARQGYHWASLRYRPGRKNGKGLLSVRTVSN